MVHFLPGNIIRMTSRLIMPLFLNEFIHRKLNIGNYYCDILLINYCLLYFLHATIHCLAPGMPQCVQFVFKLCISMLIGHKTSWGGSDSFESCEISNNKAAFLCCRTSRMSESDLYRKINLDIFSAAFEYFHSVVNIKESEA